MKLLIINSDYPDFLRWLYGCNPGLEKRSYDEQMEVRNESLFGVADFYSTNLRKLGHETHDIHVNNGAMQAAWAMEHGLKVERCCEAARWWREQFDRARRIAIRTPLWYLRPVLRPLVRRLGGERSEWLYGVLSAQIKHYTPDVLINQDPGIASDFFGDFKGHIRLVVGQIASPVSSMHEFRGYDLVLSSLPNFVQLFRQSGIPSELSKFAFEPAVLKRLRENGVRVRISFVGSLFRHHETRIHLLTHLCRRFDVQLWGHGIENVSWHSPLRRRFHGNAWGIQMYQILHCSDITLNHHIGVAQSYANNMRLFEATGVGALLVTDWKENLSEMFEPGKEVVTYRDPEECAEVIEYYLGHEEERKAVARAGQARTLQEHNYGERMQELMHIIKGFL